MNRFQLLALLSILAARTPITLAQPRPVGGEGGADAAPPPAAQTEKRTKGPTEITAREAGFDNRTHEATFSGAVLVKDPEFNLSCERMAVYLKKPDAKEKPAGGSGIERAVAEVDVVITQEKQDADGKKQKYTGRAKKAVFDNLTGNVTLTGWPQVSHNEGGSMTKQIVSREESCVIIINRAGKIDVKGYHTTTLQDAGPLDPGSR
jgi:lipopolysaccharide transport protein LptA